MTTSTPTFSTFSTAQQSHVTRNQPRLMTDNPTSTSISKCIQTNETPTPPYLLSPYLGLPQGKDCYLSEWSRRDDESSEVGGGEGNMGKTSNSSSATTDESMSLPSITLTTTSPTSITTLATILPPAPTYISTTLVHTFTSSHPSTTSIPAFQPSSPQWSPRSAMMAAVLGALGLAVLVSLAVLCPRSWYRRASCWPAFCLRQGRDVHEQNIEAGQEINNQLQNNSSTTSLTTLLSTRSYHRGHCSNDSQGRPLGTGGMVPQGGKVTGIGNPMTIEILDDGDNGRQCGSQRYRTEHSHPCGGSQRSYETRDYEPSRYRQPQSQSLSIKNPSCYLNGQTSFDLKPWHLGCALGVNAPLVVVHDPDGRCVDTLGHNRNSPSFTPLQQSNPALSTPNKPMETSERSRWSLLQRFPPPPPKVKKNQVCHRKQSTPVEGSRCNLKGAQSIRRICLAAYHAPFTVHPLDTHVQCSLQGNRTPPLSKIHYRQQRHRQQYQQRYRQGRFHEEVVQYNQSKSITRSIRIIKQAPLQQCHKDFSGSSDGKKDADLPIIVIVTDELKYPAKVESPTLPSAPQAEARIE